jgi:hypothetical protein
MRAGKHYLVQLTHHVVLLWVPLLSCSVDPGLASELGPPLVDSLSFFDSITTHMAPVVLEALKEATGCADYGMGEARFAYRYMIT